MDMQGRTLRNWVPKGTGGQTELVRGDLKPGLYFLRMTTAEGVINRKLIIN